jgi:uncharacterized Zn-finger protein
MIDVSDDVYVDSRSVACDGGGGALGHPRVFLAIDKTDQIECPYCSRRFIYRPAEPVAGSAADTAPKAAS